MLVCIRYGKMNNKLVVKKELKKVKKKMDVIYGRPFELNGGVDVVAFDNNQVRSGR